MVRATKAKQPAGLVFVNIGHPDETKTSEFRTNVARTAMINRPRDGAAATTTKAPSMPSKPATTKARAASATSASSTAKAATSSSSTLPPQHRSSTSSITSSQGHKNSLTSPDEGTVNAAGPSQYAYPNQQGSPPALEYAIASPESAELSPPGLFHFSYNDTNNSFVPNPQHADDSYFSNYKLANMHSHGSSAQYGMEDTSPPIVTSPLENGTSSYSASNKSASIDSSTSSNSIAKIRKDKRSESSGSNNNNNAQVLQVARKKAFKQRHNPSVTGMISGIPDFVVRDWNNDTNPTRNVGAILDPFDALPVKANAHTQELLYQYVNAYLMSPQLGERGSPIHTRLTLSRQKLWWPMVMRSKAALCALIAYIETTPDLPIKSTNPDYLSKHQSAAIRAIHDSLSQAQNEMTDDEICFAIVLLMIAAQRQNDKQATATHARGLKTILSRRAMMFDKSRKLENATAEKGTRFPAADNGGDPAARCLYCRGNLEIESNSRESSPELEEVPTTLPADDLGEGFLDLIKVGMLSYEMKPFIETSLKWNEIAQQARRDRLSAACGASHAWTDGNIKDEARTPFDMAVMFTVRIALYLSAWLDWNHSCQAVKKMVGAVNESLKAVQDMDSLMKTCPDIVLWSTLLTGPYTEDEKARELMLQLAGRAAESLTARTGLVTFDDILTHISNKYLWTSTMTPAARTFFFEGLQAWQANGAANSAAIQQYLDNLDAMKSQQNNHNCMPDFGMINAVQNGEGSMNGMHNGEGNMNGMNHNNFAEVYQHQGMADLQAINNMNGFDYTNHVDANHTQNTNAYLNDVMLLPQVEGLSLQDQFLDMYSDYTGDNDYVILDHNGMQIPNPSTAMYEQGFVMDPAHYDPNALDMSVDLGADWMIADQGVNGMNGWH